MPSNDARSPVSATIWIADDDEAVRLLLTGILADAGHGVLGLEGGDAALKALEGGAPDLLILDLLMPGTSGWDVLAFMRDRPRLSSVPVAVLTAYGEEEGAPSSRPVIHKPVDADLLLRLVDELLEQSRTARFGRDEMPSDLLPKPRNLASVLPPKP